MTEPVYTCIAPHSQTNVETYSYHTRLPLSEYGKWIYLFLYRYFTTGGEFGFLGVKHVHSWWADQLDLKCFFWICSLGDLVLAIMVEKRSPFDR